MIKTATVFLLGAVITLSSCAQVTSPTGTSSGQSGKNTGSQGISPSSTSSNQGGNPLGLGNDQIIQGLKDALSIAAQKSSTQLSVTDGFFKNEAIKILMPPDAKVVEDKLRSLGFDEEVDNMILSMNRAAETAAKDAAPIFIDAIKSMSVNDAMGIVKGQNDAATQYLKTSTSSQLTTKFKPVIKSALDKVDATKYWSEVFSTYNKIPFVKPVDSDLTSYVTQKALDGLFLTMAQQEAQIRKDPAGTSNDLITQIFGKK